MPTTEERLTAIEEKITQFEQMLAAFAEGPGRKLAAMFGFTFPEIR